jgi:phosphoribosylanthranilate isomerase
MLLFDSGGKGQGGTGHKFDWNMLKDLDIQIPYLLSGGIEPGDAEFIKNIGLKGMLGVDINSRFEVSPGLKDIDRLAEFIEEIRK